MSNSPNPAHIQNNATYIDTKMTSDRATLSRLDELVFIPQLVSSLTPLSPTPSLIFSSSPSFKNENSELYDHFIRILFTTRESMPDDLWEESVFECLGNWPNLIEQFKQIIIRETINF
nr:5628_t:CDS:2 [Entrophospora candida]